MSLEKLDNEMEASEEIYVEIALITVMIVLFVLLSLINFGYGNRGLALIIITGSEFFISVQAYFLIIKGVSLIIRLRNYKYHKKRRVNKLNYENYIFLSNKLKNDYMKNKLTKEEAKAESEYIHQKHKEYNEKLKWIKTQISVKEEKEIR